MDLNDIRSLVTLLSLGLFVALMVWTWWPARQCDHEAASLLPFAGEAADAPLYRHLDQQQGSRDE